MPRYRSTNCTDFPALDGDTHQRHPSSAPFFSFVLSVIAYYLFNTAIRVAELVFTVTTNDESDSSEYDKFLIITCIFLTVIWSWSGISFKLGKQATLVLLAGPVTITTWQIVPDGILPVSHIVVEILMMAVITYLNWSTLTNDQCQCGKAIRVPLFRKPEHHAPINGSESTIIEQTTSRDKIIIVVYTSQPSCSEVCAMNSRIATNSWVQARVRGEERGEEDVPDVLSWRPVGRMMVWRGPWISRRYRIGHAHHISQDTNSIFDRIGCPSMDRPS